MKLLGGIACQFIDTGTTLAVNGIAIDYTSYYDKWIDIICTYKNGNEKIYIDGKLIGSGDYNISPYSSFVIGNSYVETIGNRRMKGEISSVKVWSKELTENEIMSLDMGTKNTRNTSRIFKIRNWARKFRRNTKNRNIIW